METSLRDSVAAELARILSRPPLATSPSLSRLLRFLVEETLAQRTQEIGEYNIGVRVFARAEDFNPRTDPIVRVQTHHLRARLGQYYAAAGAEDPIVIELPSRTYVPQFREAAQPAPAMPEASMAPLEAPPAAAPTKFPREIMATTVAMLLVSIGAIVFLGHAGQRPKHHDPDATAQNLYTRGRFLLDRQTEPALRQSVDCFRQSTARDPRFAAAFAGLADAFDMLVQYGYMQPREGMEEARRAVKQALSLDPGLAEAHVSLAAISEAYDWDFKTAEREYRRAIELDPELPAAHLWYGMFLRDQGRRQQALPELRRAEQLEPLSVLAAMNLAHALRLEGDSDSALELARRAAELDPELPIPELMMANLYRSRSDLGNADATMTRARQLSEGNPHALSTLACLYARMGNRSESANLFQQLQNLATARYVSPYDLASVALALGDEDRAVSWFEEAYRQRSAGIVLLRSETDDTVKRSPRVQLLIRRMGNG